MNGSSILACQGRLAGRGAPASAATGVPGGVLCARVAAAGEAPDLECTRRAAGAPEGAPRGRRWGVRRGEAPRSRSMTDAQVVSTFFAQVAVILLVCRAVGYLAARVGQPQVVAEMVAGFLMGPSLFGWIAPGLQEQVFPAASRHALVIVSQIGVVLYMFCVGLEFRSELMIRHARRAAAVSIAGIAAPLALGGALAVLLMRSGRFFAPEVQTFHAVLFVGAALSITAFPVLARIIYERGIAGTAMGSLALAAGALDDAAAWVILAIVLGSFTGHGTLAVVAAAGAMLYVAGVFGAIRPMLVRFEAAAQDRGGLAPWILSTMLALLAGGASLANLVGIHSVFGAFVLGAATPRGLLSRLSGLVFAERYGCSAEAVTPVRLCRFPRLAFLTPDHFRRSRRLCSGGRRPSSLRRSSRCCCWAARMRTSGLRASCSSWPSAKRPKKASGSTCR